MLRRTWACPSCGEARQIHDGKARQCEIVCVRIFMQGLLPTSSSLLGVSMLTFCGCVREARWPGSLCILRLLSLPAMGEV
jgi:hypothetical protein